MHTSNAKEHEKKPLKIEDKQIIPDLLKKNNA
jgi:hypothetical protein